MKKEEIMEKIFGHGFPDAEQVESINYIVVGKDVFLLRQLKRVLSLYVQHYLNRI